MRRHGLWLVLATLIGVAQADEVIYRSRDADGKPSFSDRPAAGSQPMALPPVNTVPAPAGPPPQSSPGHGQVTGYRLALRAPSTVPNGLVPTPVHIEVQPALRPGHRWQLLLDGERVAEGQGGSHNLGSLGRGSHRLLLQVVDGNGEVLASDGPVELFVLRPGQN